jgi:hypothetical protein
MTRRIIHKLVIDDVSAVDRPANKLARAVIMKRDNGDDDMSTNFGKAAEAEWAASLRNYAERNNISVAKATLEFANTIEAREIYKRTLRTPRAENISKAAATGNVSAATLAAAAFPDLSPVAAMNAWLKTDDGRTFYSDDVAARTRAQQGF